MIKLISCVLCLITLCAIPDVYGVERFVRRSSFSPTTDDGNNGAQPPSPFANMFPNSNVNTLGYRPRQNSMDNNSVDRLMSLQRLNPSPFGSISNPIGISAVRITTPFGRSPLSFSSLNNQLSSPLDSSNSDNSLYNGNTNGNANKMGGIRSAPMEVHEILKNIVESASKIADQGNVGGQKNKNGIQVTEVNSEEMDPLHREIKNQFLKNLSDSGIKGKVVVMKVQKYCPGCSEKQNQIEENHDEAENEEVENHHDEHLSTNQVNDQSVDSEAEEKNIQRDFEDRFEQPGRKTSMGYNNGLKNKNQQGEQQYGQNLSQALQKQAGLKGKDSESQRSQKWNNQNGSETTKQTAYNNNQGSGKQTQNTKKISHPKPSYNGGLTEEQIKDIRKQVLDRANYYRKLHNLPLFTMVDGLNNWAQDWANKIINQNDPSKIHRPSNEQPYGENIYGNSMLENLGQKSVDAWYNEIKYFDVNDDERGVSSNGAIGHMTQLLWKPSVRLGVGVSRCNDGMYKVVANFDDAGNYIGQFLKNLPTITEEHKAEAAKAEAKAQEEENKLFSMPMFQDFF